MTTRRIVAVGLALIGAGLILLGVARLLPAQAMSPEELGKAVPGTSLQPSFATDTVFDESPAYTFDAYDASYILPTVCPASGGLTFKGVSYYVTLPDGTTEPLCPHGMTLEQARLRINILSLALDDCGKRNEAFRKQILEVLQSVNLGER